MKHSLLPQLLLPLLLFTLGSLSSCSDMTDEDGNNALSSLQHAPPLVQEAQALLSNHSVRMVDTHSGDHIPPANRPRKSRAASNQETFTVDWEDFKVTRCFGQEVALIPLTRQTQTAFVNLTIQGRPKKSVQKVLSKLIIRRDSLSGGIIPVVGTYIYEKKYAAKYKELLDTLGYDFTGTGFTGYFIASRTDGTMLSGTRWDKGNVHFEFEANPVPIELHRCGRRTASVHGSQASLCADTGIDHRRDRRCQRQPALLFLPSALGILPMRDSNYLQDLP